MNRVKDESSNVTFNVHNNLLLLYDDPFKFK